MNTTTLNEVRENVRLHVDKLVAEGEDVRRRVAEVVSQEACRCQESGKGFVELIQSVIDGARDGLEKALPRERDNVLREVVEALGDGLSQTALAARLAVEEAVSSSRRYREQDLTRLGDDLTAIRSLFEETVAQSLKKGKQLTADQIANAKTHATRVADSLTPVFTEFFDTVRQNPVAFARQSINGGVSAGQGAAESLCTSLSRLLKQAGCELERTRKHKA
jgi:hypothetical protein